MKLFSRKHNVHFFSAALLLTAMLLSISCKKSGLTDSHGNVVVEGNIELTVHAMHHSWGVSYINIYLKRNATIFPGKDSTLYEINMQADGDGYAIFPKLYPGNYYVYASGYDYYFGSRVLGYMPIVLNSFTVTGNKATVLLNVSE